MEATPALGNNLELRRLAAQECQRVGLNLEVKTACRQRGQAQPVGECWPAPRTKAIGDAYEVGSIVWSSKRQRRIGLRRRRFGFRQLFTLGIENSQHTDQR